MLRAATEDTVIEALDGACVQLPITSPAEAVELFNCMLDRLLRLDTTDGCAGDD
jgi:hypothetical protein